MKKYKKWFGSFVLVTMIWFLSFGCVTKGLWRDSSHYSNYNETLLAFYSNTRTKNIVFIGEKYHYIFNKHTETLIELLNDRVFLNLEQENLQIRTTVDLDKKNQTQSHISVVFKDEKLTEKQKNWLLSHHYRLYKAPPRIAGTREEVKEAFDVYVKNYNITGIRYRSRDDVNNNVLKLKRAIALTVSERKLEEGATVYKVLMTPITLTADAGLALAGAVILPIVWIMK